METNQLPPVDPPPERNPNPDPGTTLFKAFAVIVMFVISVFGMIYVAHMLWTGGK